ncbi:MAG: hypothetical protein ACRDRJ_04760 [Streptosporangiaceae bacterium]
MKSLAANAIPVWASLKEQRVALAEIGEDDLSFPGFEMAVARTADWWHIDAAGFLNLVAKELPHPPRGFIFHTCRCGSTLAANMLGAHPLLRAIKEPELINQFLLQRRIQPDEPGSSALLHALISSFGRGLGQDYGTVVKFTSWNLAFADFIMRAFPDVGAMVMWRSAAPTVASFVTTPPAWAALRSSPAEFKEIFGEYTDDGVPSDLAEFAFYGTAWLAFANYGIEMARRYPDRVTLVDYDDMCSSFPAFIDRAAAWLGITATEETMRAMLSVTRFYAKGTSQRAVFNPAAAHARPALSRAQADIVDRICGATEAIMQNITARPET